MKKMLLISVLVISAILSGSCFTPSAPVPTGPEPTTSVPDAESEGLLAEPTSTGNSVELCLNSRYSNHNPTGTASDQQLSNVLWAAGKAPITGSFRDIYVANQNGTYLYDPSSNKLNWHSSDVASRGAFVLSFERELHFDAGLSYMPAILASISLWGSTESSVSNCPMRSKLYFGVQDVRGLNSEVVAHSSVPEGEDGWLPDPKTTGDNTVEAVLADLKYTSNFSQTNLTKQQISQILWAGYGCTPHTAATGAMGLTVPSAMARYFLTETIYLVNENGVYRYHNRNPSTDLKTRDHRIERIKSGDVRSSLQSAVSGLSQAPCYVVLCLKSPMVGQEFCELEVGFVASNILMQASAIDLGCYFKTKLASDEQEAIQNTTGIPSSHIPQVVISIGNTPD
ncbi:MAG: nitroreductase family protein [Chloroflexota bacterium]|nr:MAG: nitroreductase family protein [Chloroflexota bacterium]